MSKMHVPYHPTSSTSPLCASTLPPCCLHWLPVCDTRTIQRPSWIRSSPMMRPALDIVEMLDARISTVLGGEPGRVTGAGLLLMGSHGGKGYRIPLFIAFHRFSNTRMNQLINEKLVPVNRGSNPKTDLMNDSIAANRAVETRFASSHQPCSRHKPKKPKDAWFLLK